MSRSANISRQNTALTVMLVLLMVTSALTAFGFYELSQKDVPGNYLSSGFREAIVLFLFILLLEFLTSKSRFRSIDLALSMLVLMFVVTGVFWQVLAVSLFLLSSYVVGFVILRATGVAADRMMCVSVCLVGVTILATMTGIIAHFPISYPGVYYVILLLPLFIWRGMAISTISSLREGVSKYHHIPYLDITVICLAAVHFSVALMPEVGHDALVMHLFIPEHMAHLHQWDFDVTKYVWAVLPMQGDWVYTFLNMLGGETAARLINVTMIILVGVVINSMVNWAGGNKAAGRVAVILYLSTPLTYAESSSLLIESVWSAMLLSGSFEFIRYVLDDEPEYDRITLAAILLGSAMAAKVLTGAVLVALLILGFAYSKRLFHLSALRYVVRGCVLFLILGGIPYLNAWISTGNPVFPFYNAMFQSEFYPTTDFKPPAMFEKGVDWDTLYRMTFESGKYLEAKPGASGFHLLLLLLPSLMMLLLTRNLRALVLAGIALVALVITFGQTAYLRYVFPSFAIFDVLIGVSLAVVLSHGRGMIRYAVFTVVFASIMLNLMHFKSATYYGVVDIDAILSESGRYEYLEKRLPIRNAVDLLNSINVTRQPVAVYSSPLMAGLKFDAVYFNWYNHRYRKLLNNAVSEDDVVEVLMRARTKYLLLNDAWGRPAVRELLRSVTDEIFSQGAISVRVIKSDLLFKQELLSDTDFSSDGFWVLHNGAYKKADGIVVNNTSSATQLIPVTGGRPYKLTVTASCFDEPAKGRLQINWKDVEAGFIKTDIKVFDCVSDAKSYSAEFTSPQSAASAVVYATGHTARSIIVNNVSLRK